MGARLAETWETALCPWLFEPFERLERARADGLLGHAWLIAGPRGIGKANLASALATRLLHRHAMPPAQLDAAAAADLMATRREESDHHPDLHYLAPAPDKRSVSVEQVRDVIATLELTSHAGAAKSLIVEPAESMTLAAANALLKTLEEPTPSTYFFLVSHQPGLLPATVRSRCQVLSIPSPEPAAALDWLGGGVGEGLGTTEVVALMHLCGGAPLRVLELAQNDYSSINIELEDVFKQISESRIDPQAVADRWLKGDPEIYLSWLATRLEWAIKARLAPEASTPVTDLSGDALHNAWRSLTLKHLFERLDEARNLISRLGGGVNVELALRVLLLGFQPGRG